MTISLKPSQQRTLQAFLIALSVAPPLSDDLRTKIQAIGQSLAQNDLSALDRIPDVLKASDTLQTDYNKARLSLYNEYQSQERDKFVDLALEPPLDIPNLDNLINIAHHLLKADNFQKASQAILKKIQPDNISETFVNTWKAFVRAEENAILQAIESHPLTRADIAVQLNIPTEKVNATLQKLWDQGKIDTLNGGIFRKIIPSLRSNQSLNPAAPLTLTTSGYFQLHPLWSKPNPPAPTIVETAPISTPDQSPLLPLLIALEQNPTHFSDETLTQLKKILSAFPDNLPNLNSFLPENFKSEKNSLPSFDHLPSYTALKELSETELISRIDRKIVEITFSHLLTEATTLSANHPLPPDYRFNREELYNEYA